MKRNKTCTDRVRRMRPGHETPEIKIENLLEIKSAWQMPQLKQASSVKRINAGLIIPSDSQNSLPLKYNKLISYIKSLEEENKKLQFEIFAAKEENSQLSRVNKELSIKNSSQQSYITRLNVEISKLNRNLYSIGTGDIQVTFKPKIRAISKKIHKPKNLLRSISNSCIDRRTIIEKIIMFGFS